jgi:hypothetical protein
MFYVRAINVIVLDRLVFILFDHEIMFIMYEVCSKNVFVCFVETDSNLYLQSYRFHLRRLKKKDLKRWHLFFYAPLTSRKPLSRSN